MQPGDHEPSWRQAVRNIVPTPEDCRRWVTTDHAQSILRCSADEFAYLRDEGLIVTKDRFVDEFDIWNIGLYSQSRQSRPELEMASFGRMVSAKSDLLSPVRYQLVVEATCPRGERCESHTWSDFEISGAEWKRTTISTTQGRWLGVIELHGTRAAVNNPAIVDVWQAALAKFRFHYTPRVLGRSATATLRRGVGDCAGLSYLLAQLLTEHGIEARVCAGFLAGGRVARIHHWVDVVDSDGSHKTLDLSMAILAPTFFNQKYARFCFGSTLNRIISVPSVEATSIYHQCGAQTFEVDPKIMLSSPVKVERDRFNGQG